LERFQFGTALTANAGMPAAGWWWNAAEPGRGWFAEVQGDYLYMSGFMYLDDGRPVWYLAAGSALPVATPTFTRPLLSCTGGPMLNGVPVSPANVQCIAGSGAIAVVFNSSNSMTLTLPSGVQQTLTRFPF
jgi:hypothetical protein